MLSGIKNYYEKDREWAYFESLEEDKRAKLKEVFFWKAIKQH